MVRTRAVVIVEGDSDRVALETLAKRRGRDLAAEGVEITAIGGAHAIRRFMEKLDGSEVQLVGLVDARQEEVFRRFGIDVYVCDTDLDASQRCDTVHGSHSLTPSSCGIGFDCPQQFVRLPTCASERFAPV